MKLECRFVDKVKRFSLCVDEASGRTFLSIPVRNSMVEYEEHYEIDRATFDAWLADPTRADDFVTRARRRELDHLLLFAPGADRGSPDD